MSGEGEADSFLARAQEGMGTRFQSQASIEKQNEQRDKDWQAAYARLGQEPPKEENNYVHDGRTLYERLELNKKLNEEEWDHKMKLGNQYRGLDSEETSFLNARKEEQRAKEMAIKEMEQQGLAEYRQALAARQAATLPADSSDAPTPPGSAPSTSTKASLPSTNAASARKPVIPGKAAKKDIKSLMKGVVVKKKPSITADPKSSTASGSGTASASGSVTPGSRAGPSGTGTALGGTSGAATPTHTATGGARTLATANEMRNSQTVGAAGMTALGKRLVQASPSPSPSPSPERSPADLPAVESGNEGRPDEDEREGKRAKVDP